MTSKLLAACPFCGCEMFIQSNRDWHHLLGKHDDECMFEADPEPTTSVPATYEQLGALVRDWNRRQSAVK